jgi:Cys-tRNA(Pro)/Cys-tRNA(Cys) deacylase
LQVNNVTRLLQAHNIAFTVFELPTEKLGALETAALLGINPEQVFKTIVVLRGSIGKPILVVLPGPYEVNLKKLATSVGDKKLRLATQREAEQVTGLRVGGISPLALTNRGFQCVIDESALLFDAIHISGGERGLNIRLAPTDLITLTKALVADISS